MRQNEGHHPREECGCGDEAHGSGQGGCGCEERRAPHRKSEGSCCEGEGHLQQRDECGCGGGHARHHGDGQGGPCGCTCPGGSGEGHPPFRRRFSTRAERIAVLEQYLQDLRIEAQAVEERIAEMQAA